MMQLSLIDYQGLALHLTLELSQFSRSPLSASIATPSLPPSSIGMWPGSATLYVPYWFANHSGLPLLYATRPGAREGRMCAGQSGELSRNALIDIETASNSNKLFFGATIIDF